MPPPPCEEGQHRDLSHQPSGDIQDPSTGTEGEDGALPGAFLSVMGSHETATNGTGRRMRRGEDGVQDSAMPEQGFFEDLQIYLPLRGNRTRAVTGHW